VNSSVRAKFLLMLLLFFLLRLQQCSGGISKQEAAKAALAATTAATKRIVERWHATGRPMSIPMGALSSTWHVLTLGACGPMSMMAASMQYEQAAVSTVTINMQYREANLLIHLLPSLPLPPAATGVSLSATRCGTKARTNGVRRGHRCLFDELLGASGLGLDVFTAVHGF